MLSFFGYDFLGDHPSTLAQDSQNGRSYSSTATPWMGARFMVLWAHKPKLEIARQIFGFKGEKWSIGGKVL
ncbi:expressed unknown protein [Ectocarpus siliculosus]|uniref:Uncharacterized protein n=1 Tax=Ectocarpus siliculosus TaxID=2880 RepID=D8LID2_ECTSI|nr:expressed unknown protein [Ectocarpus siliculosus]|eukprot:CBN79971.1 expressed unknown protein [Ectocarpus siliculosus]